MKKLPFILILVLFYSSLLYGQLKPHIGLDQMPLKEEVICEIPVVTGSKDLAGLPEGEAAYDFSLYALDGEPFHLSEKIAEKPILLVNGSYTCPIFRNKIKVINEVAETYKDFINVAIVYTVEAHPTDISPYFGFINITNANEQNDILFLQPTTYVERENIVQLMLENETINVPVFIDGACNEWWEVFGHAPNNSYLIDQDGIVLSKHGWFDRAPFHSIHCDLDSLYLNQACEESNGGGELWVDQIDYGVKGDAGSTLYAFADLKNTGDEDLVVLAVKLQKNYPEDWQTAFCADICYEPSEDTILFSISAGETMHFSIDFITSLEPGEGNVRIGFRNQDNFDNKFSLNFLGHTEEATVGVEKLVEQGVYLWPNPVQDYLMLDNSKEEVFSIYNMSGELMLQANGASPIHLRNWQAGKYFLVIAGKTHSFIKL